jgi:hypothetical protein
MAASTEFLKGIFGHEKAAKMKNFPFPSTTFFLEGILGLLLLFS